MKRCVIVLSMILTISFSGCAYSQADLDNAKSTAYEEGHSAGYKEGYSTGYGYGFEEGYDDGYEEGYHALKPVDMPPSGTILSGKETYYGSEITVKASLGASYVVSLKTASGVERLAFFVHSGDTVTVGVPEEELYVYFASGVEWYGYGKGLMFGDDTSYSMDDEILDFANYTWEYTLYPVTNGNFTETPCGENDFF